MKDSFTIICVSGRDNSASYQMRIHTQDLADSINEAIKLLHDYACNYGCTALTAGLSRNTRLSGYERISVAGEFELFARFFDTAAEVDPKLWIDKLQVYLPKKLQAARISCMQRWAASLGVDLTSDPDLG